MNDLHLVLLIVVDICLVVWAFSQASKIVKMTKKRLKEEQRITRAQSLLEHVLGPKLHEEYKKWGYVDVKSKLHPPYSYRITHGPITIVWGDQVIGGICIYCPGDFPEEDQVVAQYLVAKYDEAELQRVGRTIGIP